MSHYPSRHLFIHVVRVFMAMCLITLLVVSKQEFAHALNQPSHADERMTVHTRAALPSSSTALNDVTILQHLVEFDSPTDTAHHPSRQELIRPSAIHSPNKPSPPHTHLVRFHNTANTLIRVADLYFDIQRIALGDDMIDVLDTTLGRTSTRYHRTIYLESYCDARGGGAYSLALAARRVELVRQYLLDLGILPHDVHVVNYGTLRPVCQRPDSPCVAANHHIQSILTFFALLKPQFGCLTRLQFVDQSASQQQGTLTTKPQVRSSLRLAPLRWAK